MKRLFLLILISNLCFYSCNNKSRENETFSENNSNLINTLEYSSPEDVGMSSVLIDSAKKIYANAVIENKVVGYQILVARMGKIVLHEAGGLKDLKNNLPMKKSSLLNVASNTKSLVAISILKLADEGKLSIDDYVHEYLPGFDSLMSNKITIKQLLLHKSGYMNFSPFLGAITQKSPENPDAPNLIIEAKKIGLSGPEKEPNTVYRYNNMGYNILSAIIEKVSGLKLDEYFRTNIYKPLEMNETFHFKHQFDTAKMAKQYYFFNDKWEEMEVLFTPFARGNAGTISTAYDFAKLFQMLVNKGRYNNNRILEEKTVIEATSPLIDVPEAYLSEEIEKELGLPDSEWYEYRDPRGLNIDKHRGYGFVVSDNGGYSHAGIYGTFAYADPNEELVIIIFTQSIYGGNPGQKFIEIIYEAIKEKDSL